MSLRSAVIRLAAARPDLREHLLPLVKTAIGDGHHVAVKVLPPVVQRALRDLGYGRRDIEVRAADAVSVRESGGDGYRGFACIINMSTGDYKIMRGSWGGANPWSTRNQVDMDEGRHSIPPNGAVIKGTEGGGRPVYAVLYVNPDAMPTYLPEKPTLTPDEDKALAIISGIKPGYRADSFDRYDLGLYTKDNPIVRSLVEKGLVKATGAGIQITTEGRNAVNPRVRVI